MTEHPSQRYNRDKPLVIPRMEIFLDSKRQKDDPLEYVYWIVRIDGEDCFSWPAGGYESDQDLAEHALKELTASLPA